MAACRRVRKTAKSDYYLRHFCLSVHVSVYPHRTTLLPLDRFWRNVEFEDFSKICQENSSWLKSDKNIFSLHADQCEFMIISPWSLRRMRNNSGKNVKIKAYFMFNKFFSRKSLRLWDNVEKRDRSRQTSDESIILHRKDAIDMPHN